VCSLLRKVEVSHCKGYNNEISDAEHAEYADITATITIADSKLPKEIVPLRESTIIAKPGRSGIDEIAWGLRNKIGRILPARLSRRDSERIPLLGSTGHLNVVESSRTHRSNDTSEGIKLVHP